MYGKRKKMKIESSDTLGGYRLEFCSESKEEERLLKSVEESYRKIAVKLLKDLNKKIIKENKK